MGLGLFALCSCAPESLSSRCCLETPCSSFKARSKCHLTCDAFPCGSRLLPVPPVLPQNSVHTAIRVVIAPSCNCALCVCSSRSKMGVAHLYPLCVNLCSQSVCMVSGTGGGSVNASEGAVGWANRTDRGLPTCTFRARPLEGSLTPRAASPAPAQWLPSHPWQLDRPRCPPLVQSHQATLLLQKTFISTCFHSLRETQRVSLLL